MHVESRKTIQLNLFAKQKQRHRHREHIYGYQGWGEIGINIYIPLCIKKRMRTYCIVWASLVAQLVKIHLQCRRPGFDPWVGKIPWRRERLPTPVFCLGEFHGLYSPWGCKESDMTEQLSLPLHFTVQHRELDTQCSVVTKMGRKFKEKEIYVYMWLIHFAVQQKLTQHCKAPTL